MDVTRPLHDSIAEDEVGELHQRRGFDVALLHHRWLHILDHAHGISEGGVGGGEQVLDDAVGRIGAGQLIGDRARGSELEHDSPAAREPEIALRFVVLWIARGDRELAVTLAKREHPVLARDFFGDEARGFRLDSLEIGYAYAKRRRDAGSQ